MFYVSQRSRTFPASRRRLFVQEPEHHGLAMAVTARPQPRLRADRHLLKPFTSRTPPTLRRPFFRNSRSPTNTSTALCKPNDQAFSFPGDGHRLIYPKD